jgi:hypothetical protein
VICPLSLEPEQTLASRDWLDVRVLPRPMRVADRQHDARNLVADAWSWTRLTLRNPRLEIIAPQGSTWQWSMPVRVRAFARAVGLLAKTVRIDALAITRYAEAVEPMPRASSSATPLTKSESVGAARVKSSRVP